MARISTNVGTKPVGLSFNLFDISPSGYSRRPIRIDSGSVTAGMQRLADRFTVTLFNLLGSTKHDENFGTTLVSSIVAGSAMNFGVVQSFVAVAVDSAASQLVDDDDNEAYFDEAGDDEKLESAVCDSVEYDPKTGTLRMYVSLTNRVGEDYTYILPVNMEFPA